ncbi:DapH/DapD/GlmU-related protein [Microbacterium excoecariae]|uniref:DapH/DapD/GlmU-related protein n=1 Tax=Microbacterium excoecariae TaxID=2715210 RepID=UPI001407648A|nr:DapH/DapD/GlmU-related protein [Microbacterium excoecariae]NHI17462.1 transferase [Microbacterium excoecariae]
MLEVDETARVDKTVRFNHGSSDVRVGARTKIYRGGEFTGPVAIGEDAFINRDAYVRPHTTIGDRVNLGPFVRLVTDSHAIGPHERRAGTVRHDPIVLGDGCWIGASATVLGGVTVGAGAIVAAGAIVTEDVPDDVLVAGVPARVVRRLDA